jgi:hypothetical protein
MFSLGDRSKDFMGATAVPARRLGHIVSGERRGKAIGVHCAISQHLIDDRDGHGRVVGPPPLAGRDHTAGDQAGRLLVVADEELLSEGVAQREALERSNGPLLGAGDSLIRVAISSAPSHIITVPETVSGRNADPDSCKATLASRCVCTTVLFGSRKPVAIPIRVMTQHFGPGQITARPEAERSQI